MDAVARPNVGRERVKMRNEQRKNEVVLFLGLPYFFVLRSDCGTEGGTTDWNSRTKQSERPKRDRLIALVILY
jgi:hypothetical protein